jgi:uncharacterized protein (TIGR03435 family)
MTELDDHELLAEYARNQSEAAFAVLVVRYVNLVYSAARRFSGNPHHAEEITQAVFIILARKAGSLRRGAVLSGWLYQTARLTAANFVKGEIRRQHREQEAYMQSTVKDLAAWQRMEPLLDEAMGFLGETDRNAVVLRFFESKTAREVAVALKMNEAAAHKRVARALEKLRKFFVKRGIVLSATAIAGAVSANSVQAAPTGMAQIISTVALAKGAAAGGSTITLVKGALKFMAWTKAKVVIITGMVVVLAAATTTVTVEKIHEHQNEVWQLGEINGQLLNNPPYRTVILPTRSAERSNAVGTGGWTGDNGKILGINLGVGELMCVAYGIHGQVSEARTVLSPEIPTNRYDLLSNLPTGAREALQRELKRKLGVVGRFETIETNVLFLKVKYQNATGLKRSVAHNNSNSSSGNNEISGENCSTDTLARALEDACNIPVINQTGLAGDYDYKVRWNEYGEKVGDSYPNYPNVEGLKQALTDQVGLELVPDTAPIKMFFVEKARF